MILLPPPSDAKAALAWADRLYAPLVRESSEGFSWNTEAALEAYRAVARRYPGESRAHVGVARCLFRLGKYGASVKEFRGAERAMAVRYASAQHRIQMRLPRGQVVQHLILRPGNEWIALTARRVDLQDESFSAYRDLFLRTYRGFVETGKPVKVPIGRDDCRYIGVFVPPGPGTFFVQTVYMAGSSIPNAVHCVNFEKGRPVVRPALRSLGETRIWVEDGRPWVLVTPTYKVWWSDVYAFDRGRVSFATFRRPGVYRDRYERPRGEEARAYHNWMRYAAQLTILRRRTAALEAWRMAERCARRSVVGQQWGARPDLAYYPDYGMYGDTRENLREIRQRIAWLRRGDWNHWLLYRPYDWGLQIAPYRLGKALTFEDSTGW